MKVLSLDPIEEVFRSDHQRLWRSLLAYTGDADMATEAEAEVFSQAFGRGDELIDPQAWIWRSAFKVAGGLLARRSQRREAEEPLHGMDTGGLDDPALVDFLAMLETLSDQQRAIVVLRYAGGFKPGEIAELLQSTSGSVRAQLHRAHEHLRERIEN